MKLIFLFLMFSSCSKYIEVTDETGDLDLIQLKSEHLGIRYTENELRVIGKDKFLYRKGWHPRKGNT